jgi:hypothetical protein
MRTHLSINIELKSILQMKNLTIILTLTIASLYASCNNYSVDTSQSVNPILGDISYENKFGYKPDATTDNLRIQTHLAFVEDLLRKKDVSDLSKDIQNKRIHHLNLLKEYRTNGLFPKNYDYPGQRKPCFIDVDGNICAVGYLIEQTASRKVAEDISRKYKYYELLAMNDKAVDNWVATSGLTKEECAMIQPTYGPPPSPNHITPEYGISSAIITGLNLSFNTVNGIQIGRGAKNTVPIIGLITGAVQTAMGAAMFPKASKVQAPFVGEFINTNESQKTLSMVNIGLGTTTMILSAWNLITNRKPKDKSTTWNIYKYPTQGKNTGFAVNMTKRF